jgi:hypothetical protein
MPEATHLFEQVTTEELAADFEAYEEYLDIAEVEVSIPFNDVNKSV